MAFGNLFKPKYKNSNPKVRKEAIKDLDDEEILFDIVNNDEDRTVRIEALKKINKSNYLIAICCCNDDQYVRLYCVEHTKDSYVLFSLLNDKTSNRKVKCAAIKNPYFKNQDLLIKIAKNDEDPIVRQCAIERINDIPTLKYIAANDDYYVEESTMSTEFGDFDETRRVYSVREAARKRLNEIPNSTSTHTDSSIEIPKDAITPAEIRAKYAEINKKFVDEGKIAGVEEILDYAGVEYEIIEKNKFYVIKKD